MGIYRPRPLAGLVDFLWESPSYNRPHATERVLPTGAMDLVIDLAADGGACGTLSGARSTFSSIDTSRPREFIGARFMIGGGSVLFGPAGALSDLKVPLEGLWGGAARELYERLAGAPPGVARFSILERFLLRHLDREVRLHPAVKPRSAACDARTARLPSQRSPTSVDSANVASSKSSAIRLD